MVDRGSLSILVVTGSLSLIAAFMPWTSYSIRAYMDKAIAGFRAEEEEDWAADIRAADSATRNAAAKLAAATKRPGRIQFDAWDSDLEIVDLGLPNWLVPVLGGLLAVLAALCRWGWIELDARVFLGIALYAVAHMGAFLVETVPGGYVRAGAVVAALASLVAFRAAWRLRAARVATP